MEANTSRSKDTIQNQALVKEEENSGIKTMVSSVHIVTD